LFTAKQPGADAIVAVLDTGYTDHPDLEASYEGGYDFLDEFDPYGDAQSNDGDGPDTDPHDAGDFWLENSYGGPWGSSWHGTHVHGTIAATKNNGVGVVGVAPSADVIHGRVLGTWGGFDSAIAASIRWAAGLAVSGVPTNTKPADVINLSLGGSSPTCPSIYANAIFAARTAGSVVVVAAGNSNQDAGGFTPANCTGAITVAATGPEGYRSWYSNYGSVVDIAAPGGDSNYTNGGIQSTLNTGFSTPQVPTYAYYQGTSMATPHVAGVVALIRSANPDLTVEQVETILLASVNSFRADARTNSCSQSGKCGAGLVDAQKAVAAALAAGGGGGGVTDTQVQTASATVESGKATINWTAPRNVTNLSGYQVTVAGLRSSCTNTTAQLSCTFTRLKNGQSYTATIKAKYGSSYAEGHTLTFVPAGIPSSLSISGVRLGRGTLNVTWRAASPNGSAILGYRAEALFSNGSVAGFCETTTALTCTISGLSAGSYKVKLIATNAMGSASVTSRSTYRIR
jgi:serine protease